MGDSVFFRVANETDGTRLIRSASAPAAPDLLDQSGELQHDQRGLHVRQGQARAGLKVVQGGRRIDGGQHLRLLGREVQGRLLRHAAPPELGQDVGGRFGQDRAVADQGVRPGGALVYAVCTLTREESDDVVERFVRESPGWRVARRVVLRADLDGTDGFVAVRLSRDASP